MDNTRTVKSILSGALLFGGVAVTGIGLTVGTAQAQPDPLPPMHGPLSEDGPVPPGASGPYKCCPGDEKTGLHPQTGRGCPPDVNWDKSICHTWYGVVWGHGNASPGVWEGTDPPPPEATQRPPCGFPFMCSGTP
jgi:hypothetical protein